MNTINAITEEICDLMNELHEARADMYNWEESQAFRDEAERRLHRLHDEIQRLEEARRAASRAAWSRNIRRASAYKRRFEEAGEE